METIALKTWLSDVRRLHGRARRALSPAVVHDLRVAIRRCRSVAQGMREIDDDVGRAQWRALNDAGRGLFQGLGALRDAQVMRDHARDLLAGDPALPRVLAHLERRIRRERIAAKDAVLAFDLRGFAALVQPLPGRAVALLHNQPLLMHLALRRYEEARQLHTDAMRTRSSVSLHELRIRVKRLRYTVESFLPVAHLAVGKSLKKAQDMLGELHDFDVLLAWLNSEECVLHSDDRTRICAPVRTAREERLRAYHEVATGPDSLWPRVRATLPEGRALVDAHRAFFHQRAGARLQQFALARASDALVKVARPSVAALRDARARTLLGWTLACLGESDKDSRRTIRALPDATGLGARERTLMALVARAAHGKLPRTAKLDAMPVRDARLAEALCAVVHVAALLSGRVVVRRGREVITLRMADAAPEPHAFSRRRGALERLMRRPFWLDGRVERAAFSSSR